MSLFTMSEFLVTHNNFPFLKMFLIYSFGFLLKFKPFSYMKTNKNNIFLVKQK